MTLRASNQVLCNVWSYDLRWEDDIKEWTGMGFGDSLRAAEDKERWKGIVATCSVICGAPTTTEVNGLR